MASPSAVLLFDIDLTLLKTGGASYVAMTEAFRSLYGVEKAFDDGAWAGRTDISIFRETLTRHGLEVEPFDDHLAAYESTYSILLREALSGLQGYVMPGVPELLDNLTAHQGFVMGLGTGNFTGAAWAKLAHYGLEGYFRTGGFGSDHEDRGEIIRIAAERVLGAPPTPDERRRVVVIGDSIHDVNAAKCNGFRSVGVPAGNTSSAMMEEAGADLILRSLADTNGVLAALSQLVDHPESERGWRQTR